MAKPKTSSPVGVTGADNVFAKLANALNIDLMPVQKAGARLVQKTAKDLAPVDNDALRGTIFVDTDEDTAYVAAPMEYAIHQEFGTRYQKGKSFLRPALQQRKKAIQDAVKRHVNNTIRGL
jgi:HK97 gp10 family phage protein